MNAFKPLGTCCHSGFVHSGTLTGRELAIANVDCYVAEPAGKTSKAVLVLPDALGSGFQNTRLLADAFARNGGYLAVVVDMFGHDDVPLHPGQGFNINDWIAAHDETKIDPIISRICSTLRTQWGIKRIGAAGYCIGAKYVVRHLESNEFDVGFLAHPSMLSREEYSRSQGPLMVLASEVDEQLDREGRHELELVLRARGGDYYVGYQGGTSHGFAVRGDPGDVVAQRQMSLASQQALQWFMAFL